MGHLRDLPQTAAEIPAKLKQEPWARLGVDVDNNFTPIYVVPKGKSKFVRELKSKLKEVDELYLATDEDREGESISWHLIQLLNPKVPVKRMVFHEITKSAIQKALDNCRDLNMELVKAQEARRILDRIYGYTLSPLLWKKIAYGLSAGRVQSSGLKMVVSRELERMRFVKSQYFGIKAKLNKSNPSSDEEKMSFEAKLVAIEKARLATGRDFEETTGKLKDKGSDVVLLTEEKAKQLAKDLEGGNWTVESLEEKQSTSRPYAPFITSTLQQEGIRRLGLSAKMVMRTAQKLYEEGLITYMRTDSPTLSTEAVNAARSIIEKDFGKQYLPDSPRSYKAKSAMAQEAHEAIRPSGVEFVHPNACKLSGVEFQLYKLIWKRTIACQMKDAIKNHLTVKIKAKDCTFQSNGTQIVFPGHLKAYEESGQDSTSHEMNMPPLQKSDALTPQEAKHTCHETMPRARFSEASLVQGLEKEGIGRPSTYASIISTILDRGYAVKVGNYLVPTFVGISVYQLLEKNFPYFVEFKFTSEMEDKLDKIAYGKQDSVQYLKDFYLGDEGLKNLVETKEKDIKPEESRTVQLPHIKSTNQVKIGRYGAYIVVLTEDGEEVHATIPETIIPSELDDDQITELIEQQKKGPTPMGVDPKSGKNVYCLVGRYGAYLQLGEMVEGEEKPKRTSLPKPLTPSTVTMDEALQLLSLPRELGNHPETGKPIVATLGRFGPFVACDGEYRSLKKDDDLYSITLERAIELLKEEKKTRGPKVITDFGKHPALKRKVILYSGKFGPYIKVGSKNISLPEELKKRSDPENIKLEELNQVLEIDAATKTKVVKKAARKPRAKKASKAKSTASSIEENKPSKPRTRLRKK